MTVIYIKAIPYVEAKPDETKAKAAGGEVCSQCAFGQPGMLEACAFAINHADEVFGGDCAERDVIYAKAD